ncbi:sensor histidine kinase [Clostridium sp.]
MFRKLKIKLTLINLTTVLLILTFIFAGTYILLNKQLNSQVDNIMNEFLKMGSEGKMLDLSNIPKPPNMGKQNNPPEIFNCFVVEVNSSGKLIEASKNNILSEIDTNELIRNTMGSSQLKGSISMSFGTFRYISSVKQQSKLIVFYNESMQKTFMNLLIVIFIIIGIIGVLLAFLSSYFVANKALVPIKQAWIKEKTFVADASHELRTPLAVIRTNMEIVMDNENETVKSQENWLSNIKYEYMKMGKLVDDLLYLVREDNKDEKIEFSAINLSEIVLHACNAFKPLAAERGIEFLVNIEKGIIIPGDDIKMNRLICILIDNAIKYTEGSGRIEVSCYYRDKCSVIKVSDTGIGISEEDITKIFQRFYRADKSRNSETEGTGLGLSIADSIIRQFNGTLRVSSIVGKGSTFEVKI